MASLDFDSNFANSNVLAPSFEMWSKSELPVGFFFKVTSANYDVRTHHSALGKEGKVYSICIGIAVARGCNRPPSHGIANFRVYEVLSFTKVVTVVG